MELVYPPYQAPDIPGISIDNPFPDREGSEEYLPAVDEAGLVIGRTTRRYVHSGSKLLHPVVHLHILDREGRIYLQKRSMAKDLLPGYWDTAVGGHVGYGEYIMEALFREASEELGMAEFNPVYLKSYVYESASERELVNVFACVGAYSPAPDGDEVADGKFWTFREIEKVLHKSVLTPNFESEFASVRDMLTSLL